MSHEVETMAYAVAVPWHGLGKQVTQNLTPQQMLVEAGLNWKVEQHDAFVDIKGKKVPIGRKALVRATDGKILTVTGDNWHPLQNKDALGFFKEYCASGGAKMETAGSLRGGKVIWALASIQKGFTVNRTDHVKGYILLVSPHEVGKAIYVKTTGVRVVCANTMRMAGGADTAEYSQNHLSKFDFKVAKDRIKLARDEIEQMALNAKALTQLKMSEFDTVRFLAKFFQPVENGGKDELTAKEDKARINGLINDPATRSKKLEEVLTSYHKAPGATPGTAWGVLAGVTHWTDHVAGREADARMFRSWLGENGRTRDEIQKELLQMV